MVLLFYVVSPLGGLLNYFQITLILSPLLSLPPTRPINNNLIGTRGIALIDKGVREGLCLSKLGIDRDVLMQQTGVNRLDVFVHVPIM